MAHVKAGSSSAHQKANVSGKRRGLKINQGQFVRGGQILIRQTGVEYKPGLNTKLSRDHSVVSRVEGFVQFSYLRRPNGVRTVVNILPKGVVVHPVAKATVKKEAVKAEAKVEKTEKKVVAKKPATKKAATKKAAK